MAGSRRLAEVYAVTDVKLDPFSPGLRAFTRLAEKDLPALRTRTVEHLTALALADAPWKSFYEDRRAALQALRPDRLRTPGDSRRPPRTPGRRPSAP